MADWRLDARIAASDTDGGAPQIRGGQGVEVLSVVLGTVVNSVQQGEYPE